jgi:hypothetical protein
MEEILQRQQCLRTGSAAMTRNDFESRQSEIIV